MAHCITTAVWLALLLLLLLLLLLEHAMPPRKKLSPPTSATRLVSLDVLHPDACGIDIGSEFHVACVTSPDKANVLVRTFGACTADLEALADWLAGHGVTTVAMESTGVYWIPLYDLLQSKGFSVLLVAPRQIQRAPGRPKTDALDAQWIRRLHSLGLLSGAFRPEEDFRVLRCYLRQRANLIRYA